MNTDQDSFLTPQPLAFITVFFHVTANFSTSQKLYIAEALHHREVIFAGKIKVLIRELWFQFVVQAIVFDL